MRLLLIGRSRSGTVITRNIISSHPDIWLTNELRTYGISSGVSPRDSFKCNSAAECFSKFRPSKIKMMPPGFKGNDFVSRCLSKLDEDTFEGRIKAVEEVIFENKYKIFGDKTGVSKIIEFMYKEAISFKIIHIYRDGRDSVSSGMAKSRDKDRGVRWNTNDPFKGSLSWARELEMWFDIRKILDKDMYLELRFEDYSEVPNKNIKLISNFLGVENKFKNSFRSGSSHIGRYKKGLANWPKVFHEDAIKMLKKLNYI